MILADTSVWVDHFRRRSERLCALLEEGEVAVHPFIIGELACGNLRKRKEILTLLEALPHAPKAADDEVMLFIEEQRLMGLGLGLIDVHLLASCRLTPCRLWTKDKPLSTAAARLRIDASGEGGGGEARGPS